MMIDYIGHVERPSYVLTARPYRSLPVSGGKRSNIFWTSILSFLMFLLDLAERVSLAEPRQISFLVFVSNRSTTSVPTVYVCSVVVAVPKLSPNPPQRQPQPPPKLS